MKETYKYISWAVRKARVYADFGVVEDDDLWSAQDALLEALSKASRQDRRRLMRAYLDLIERKGVLYQGLSF